MSTSFTKKPYPKAKYLCFSILFTTFFVGCNSTRDLNPNSKSSHQLSINTTKDLTERIAISASVNFQSGSAKESFDMDSDTVQIDDIRFVGSPTDPVDLNYDFDLVTSKLLLDFYTVKGGFYELTISPGLSYVSYDLDFNVNEEQNFIKKMNSIGYGLQINNRFALSDNLSINLNVAHFATKSDEIGYLSLYRASLDYAVYKNLTLGLGYQYTRVGDPSNNYNNGDKCDDTSVAEECKNSEIELEAQGLLLSLKYLF
ncbi:hypothetical protein [Paraglaciecola marina]|uniref:hypothetical protein n=1 Tax=Paraglaciecola marina TaxID=2500157 RepID=UPI00105F206C|nr:hypothetical protein [Paraglaciecola marina]